MNVKNITRIALGIATVILAYFLFESIMKPQRFETLRAQKEVEIVNRLKDIRTAQLAYRNVHGRFVGTMDSLVMFLEQGRLPSVRRTGEIPEEMSEAEALKQGFIRRDTVFTDAHSALFPDVADKVRHLTNLRFVPFSDPENPKSIRGIKEFIIEAGFIERNNIQVPVIDVSAFLGDYMTEPEYKQLVINAVARASDINRFPGRKFGSMTDPITEGNWE
ncbi:MAG: hypothetical protein LBP96_02165 [Bacteroidales bacterium]|jgi:hypothetical protein|nr:hypothetical protein [Bacteroidales bacterium]